jgi:hypothetical protein
MSKLSDIYASYKSNLDMAQDDYEKSVKDRAKNAKEFYDKFFNSLIVNYGESAKHPDFNQQVADRIRRFFGRDNINFVAIDGSCDKHNAHEFISFYGGAYGSRGTLSISQSPPAIEYKRWEIDRDVSMVAFVPVPYSQLVEVTDSGYQERFLLTEDEKIDLANIHLQIMQLAEVFLAYNSATSSLLDQPNLILIDNSISTMLGSVDLQPAKVHLVGYPFERRALTLADVAIAQAHPFNHDLGVPSSKYFTSDHAVISYLHRHRDQTSVKLDEVEREFGMSAGQYHMAGVHRLVERQVIQYDDATRTITRLIDPWESWEYTKQFFQNVCKKIFLDKKENALKYPTKNEEGRDVLRWMDPIDVKFLIGVGLKALIEVCWEKKMLLTGIVKDSQSRYLTKNYLGVCKLKGEYPELNSGTFGSLPPTDRLMCELLPYLDDRLSDPWGTIEFDSAFMTLYAERDDSGREIVKGTYGSIVRPERIFLRSIFQFFARKKGENILTGHAIFVDRLAYPELDLKYAKELVIDEKGIGRVRLFFYPDNKVTNVGQIITSFLLEVLTKNHFPEVIGYPDPLHKADLGAKTMRDHVKKLLESSEWKFRSRPLSETFRSIRQSFKR